LGINKRKADNYKKNEIKKRLHKAPMMWLFNVILKIQYCPKHYAILEKAADQIIKVLFFFFVEATFP